MKDKPSSQLEEARISGPRGANAGFFILQRKSVTLRIQISDGWGWDHVSVSTAHRTPTWEEMCFVKDLFFRPDEVVMQLHPAKEEYVNLHPYCLHLWRPQTKEEMQTIREQWEREGEIYIAPDTDPSTIPLPQTIMVGPKVLSR